MSNVQVAIRVRPLNARESADSGLIAVQVEDKIVRIRNVKLDSRPDGPVDSREKLTEFGFDYCYWSVDPEDLNYASQDVVFQDLGVSVLAGASEGYNVCLFAYGQTGSGKTYTMMGTPTSVGLTPRICQGLFGTHDSCANAQGSSRVEISFLEIYNERVRDLLRPSEQKKPPALRVREHPEKGPYVQGLSQYVVSDYKHAVDLLEAGIANRITAATHIHDASSRSHAIFSIQYTQAILENNLPSEIVSKINLVDLAGSERADPQYCRARLTEGSNINKSLVTLGIVISALAQNSQMCSSCQSINSMASECEGSTVGSQSSGHSAGGRRQCFIPYRDSILTWLLRDSLGGNSKTIMIATISPSCSSYNETLSTLRYAAHARNIVNKPRVNEDANVRLIRELREEINRLKSMLLSFKMQRNPSPSLSEDRDGNFSDIVFQNELKVDQLTKDWSDSWRDKKELLEQYSVDIDRDRAGFFVRSLLPHLIALDRDVLSTGVTFYHLREGVTRIGPNDTQDEPHIVLQDEARCEIVNQRGVVTLKPAPGCVCVVNGREVTEPCRLAQGAVITLGEVHKFRFNHPEEAAILRERRRANEGELLCGYTDLSVLTPGYRVAGEGVWEPGGDGKGTVARQRVEEQKRYIECLRVEIQEEQRRAEQDLEMEQAELQRQHTDVQQWVLREKQRLSDGEKRGAEEPAAPSPPRPQRLVFGLLEGGVGDAAAGDRKRVVQEELLRHHALRRAENRVRRKRLHYQLQRVARKRLLLEAKRELQCLERALSPDSPTSSEPDWPLKAGGPSSFLRRHSFSADLLLRLYPKRTHTFSNFLRRNRSLEFSSSWRTAGVQKWMSEESFPSRRMRGRANTLPSGIGSFHMHTNTLKNEKPELLDPAQESSETAERKLSLSAATVNRKIEGEEQKMDSLEPHAKDMKAPPSVCKLSTSCTSPKRSKPVPQGSKGLERLRKVFSPSAAAGFRSTLSKLFRKPPSGFGSRVSKSSSKPAAQKGNKEAKNSTQLYTKIERCPVKMALSCDDLEKTMLSKKMERKTWHSEGALTKPVIQRSRTQPSLQGWMENRKAKDGEGSSDCDSSISVDSLSSAYAAALTEQLRHEESELSGDDSEPESVDSQISQDSLATEGSSNLSTMKPKSKHDTNDFSYWGSCTSDEIPAEVYWRCQGASNPKHASKSDTKWELVKDVQAERDSNGEAELKVAGEPNEGLPGLPEKNCPFSFSSVREPDGLLVLTDAWSSTEPSDSPRMHGDRTAVGQLPRSHAVCSVSSLQSSTELSDDLSGFENKPFYIGDSTESEDSTLRQKRYWDPKVSVDDESPVAGVLGDEDDSITESMNAITINKSMNCEVGNFQESSKTLSGVKLEGKETANLENSGIKTDNCEKEHISSDTDQCALTDVSFRNCKSLNLTPNVEYITLNNAQPLHADHSSTHVCDGISLSKISSLDRLHQNTYCSSDEKITNTESAARIQQLVLKGCRMPDGVAPTEVTTCDTDTLDTEIRVTDAMMFTSLSCKDLDKDLWQKPDLNEDCVMIAVEMPSNKIMQENVMDKSEMKCTDKSSNQVWGNIVQLEGGVKEGNIVPACLQDSKEVKRTNQTSLSTQTDVHSTLCETQWETLDMKSVHLLSDPKLEEEDINADTEGVTEDVSNIPSIDDVDFQLDTEGMGAKRYLRSTKGHLVKKMHTGHKANRTMGNLKHDVRQRAGSSSVCRAVKHFYRSKLYRRKQKCSVHFSNTKSKNVRKKKADKKVTVHESTTEKIEIKKVFKDLPRSMALQEYEGMGTLQKGEQRSCRKSLPGTVTAVSELCDEDRNTLQQVHKHTAGVYIDDSKSILNDLIMCGTFSFTESVDISLVEETVELCSQHKENMDFNQKSSMQERKEGLLECSRQSDTEESSHCPVDQKISEVVKEHMKLNMKDFEETSSTDELDCKAITTKLNMHKSKNMSLDEDPVIPSLVETTGHEESVLTSKSTAGLEDQSLVSDVTQKCSAVSQAGQESLGRVDTHAVIDCGFISGASLCTREDESSDVVMKDTKDNKQKALESIKNDESHTSFSNTVNVSESVERILKNQWVKNVSVEEEIVMETECHSVSSHACKISSECVRLYQRDLEIVNTPGTEQNGEEDGTKSSLCQVKSFLECDLSKQVHLSSPTQTKHNTGENISTEGSFILQISDNKRNMPFPHKEDAGSETSRQACSKVNQNTSDHSGTENYFVLDHVLSRSRSPTLHLNARSSIESPSLCTSFKTVEPKMGFANTCENTPINLDPENVNTIISQGCNLNSVLMQSEQFPQNVTLACSWPPDKTAVVSETCKEYSTDAAEIALTEHISSKENRKLPQLSNSTHLTEISKLGQMQNSLTNSSINGGRLPFQMVYLKSENSAENFRNTHELSSDLLTPKNHTNAGKLELEMHGNCPSPQNDRGVELKSFQTSPGTDAMQHTFCFERCSDGKTPSNIVTVGTVSCCTSDLFKLNYDMNYRLPEIDDGSLKGVSSVKNVITTSSNLKNHSQEEFLTDNISQALTGTPKSSYPCSDKDHCDTLRSRTWHGQDGLYNTICNSLNLAKETVDPLICKPSQSQNEVTTTTSCTKPKDIKRNLGERHKNKWPNNSAVAFQGAVKGENVLAMNSSSVSCPQIRHCSLKDAVNSDSIASINSAVSQQKAKPKRLKRSAAKATPASSSDSAVESSPEEKVVSKVHLGRSLLMQSRTRGPVQHKQETTVKSCGPRFSVPKDHKLKTSPVSQSSIKDSDYLKPSRAAIKISSGASSTDTNGKNDNKIRGKGKCFQEECSMTTDNFKKKAEVLESGNCSQAENSLNELKQGKKYGSAFLEQAVALILDQQGLDKNDTTMRFASSDINPFVHPWQDDSSRDKCKVFGSATNISCKDDDGSSHVIRCCSVDNGLNVKDSPFHAHLSTFAGNKKLSSTLSSIEGYKEPTLSECQDPSSEVQRAHPGTCDSYSTDVSGDLGHSSGQVDEIMLVCSSEQESSANTHKHGFMLTCNQGTQTADVDGRQKKKKLHKRNKTQVQRIEVKEVPTTWRSLQNMSLHLSQLLHSTSDLLENMQCIEVKNPNNFLINNKGSPSGKCSKRDSSTQTAVDTAIQTDGISKLLTNKATSQGHPERSTEEILKPHEVNVIVKVIGTDTVSMSQETGDITLTMQEKILKKNTSQKMQSMPDLFLDRCPKKSQSSTDTFPLRAQFSTSSLDTDFRSCSHLNSDASLAFFSGHAPEQPSASSLAVNGKIGNSVQTLRLKTQTTSHHNAKEVWYIDRASSPILTLEAGIGTQLVKNKSSQCLLNSETNELQEPVQERIRKRNSQSTITYRLQEQKKRFPCEKAKSSEWSSEHIDPLGKIYGDSAAGFSFDNISKLSCSYSEESGGCTENRVPFKGKTFKSNTSEKVKGQMVEAGFGVSKSPTVQSTIQSPRLCCMSSTSKDLHHSSLMSRCQNDSLTLKCTQEEYSSLKPEEIFIVDEQLSFNGRSLENYQRETNNLRKCLSSPESFDVSQGTVQLQEDDAISLPPSECNTDILININPIMEQMQTEHQRLPEDLPMHNKFTGWSGVGYQVPSSLCSSLAHIPTTTQNVKHYQPGQDGSEVPKAKALSDERLREIERLRQEREQVMAAVRLDMNSHQLTTELTEAKLHYGQGETDTLLKMLKTGSIEEAYGVPNKQELYDRHRRSIESLRQEREAQLQTCRRARSLSPSKNMASPGKRPELPVQATELPSQRRDYLQKLRQAVVSSTRGTAAPQPRGECPSQIELLLREYGRAREEAKTEIARARDRLRERAEQEKRRLQQQALSQLLKAPSQDDPRVRTRISSSTLCTGSSLSLSSGPTSGYNSSNTVPQKEGNRSCQTQQACGISENAVPEVRGHPPVRTTRRPWLSAQDLLVEFAGHRSSPLDPSPSAPHGQRQRTLSLNSTSSVLKSYQDIAASALARATAEIHSVAGGDLENLLIGRASGDWRYQSTERGVHAYYKPSSSPSVHCFLGAAELDRPLPSLWCMIRDHSKAHLYNECVRSAWTRPLDGGLQLVHLVTDGSTCHLGQQWDFCCISGEFKQDGQQVLALQSVWGDSVPLPGADIVRGELLPSAWVLRPTQRDGRDVVSVFYLLQVDLWTPALSQRLLSSLVKKHATVIAELDAFFSL